MSHSRTSDVVHCLSDVCVTSQRRAAHACASAHVIAFSYTDARHLGARALLRHREGGAAGAEEGGGEERKVLRHLTAIYRSIWIVFFFFFSFSALRLHSACHSCLLLCIHARARARSPSLLLLLLLARILRFFSFSPQNASAKIT